jgi:uncharacterized protein YneF (UPF0154 family)
MIYFILALIFFSIGCFIGGFVTRKEIKNTLSSVKNNEQLLDLIYNYFKL